MKVVKGSKQYRMKVVRHRPLLPFICVLAAMAIAVSAVYFAFSTGFSQGASLHKDAQQEVSAMAQRLAEKSRTLDEAQQELANIKLGASVDRQSSESVRKEVADLKTTLAELEADNNFYRNLMAPTENQRGLRIGVVELVDTPDPRRFSFKIVVQQLSTTHDLLSGSLNVVIKGQQNDIPATFFLSDLSGEVKSKSIRLRFKYFQTIEGTITLPGGFDASTIELEAKSTGKNAVSVSKRFGWLVEKR